MGAPNLLAAGQEDKYNKKLREDIEHFTPLVPSTENLSKIKKFIVDYSHRMQPYPNRVTSIDEIIERYFTKDEIQELNQAINTHQRSHWKEKYVDNKLTEIKSIGDAANGFTPGEIAANQEKIINHLKEKNDTGHYLETDNSGNIKGSGHSSAKYVKMILPTDDVYQHLKRQITTKNTLDGGYGYRDKSDLKDAIAINFIGERRNELITILEGKKYFTPDEREAAIQNVDNDVGQVPETIYEAPEMIRRMKSNDTQRAKNAIIIELEKLSKIIPEIHQKITSIPKYESELVDKIYDIAKQKNELTKSNKLFLFKGRKYFFDKLKTVDRYGFKNDFLDYAASMYYANENSFTRPSVHILIHSEHDSDENHYYLFDEDAPQ